MPYFYNTEDDKQAMLKAIGAKSIDELFSTIPDSYRMQRPLDLPPALSELELSQHMAALAGKNVHAGQQNSCAAAATVSGRDPQHTRRSGGRDFSALLRPV